MYIKWIAQICAVVVFFSSSSLFALTLNDLKKKYLEDDTKIVAPPTHILPLSYDEDPPLLLIPIPDDFKLGHDASSYPDVLFLEYILQEEGINYASETITVCQSAEIMDAHVFIKALRAVIEKTQSIDAKSNFTSLIACNLERGIKTGFYMGDRPYFKPHQLGIQAPRYHELLQVKTVQGEDRLWVVQYSIRYNPDSISEEQFDILMEKLDNFFDKCKVISAALISPL